MGGNLCGAEVSRQRNFQGDRKVARRRSGGPRLNGCDRADVPGRGVVGAAAGPARRGRGLPLAARQRHRLGARLHEPLHGRLVRDGRHGAARLPGPLPRADAVPVRDRRRALPRGDGAAAAGQRRRRGPGRPREGDRIGGLRRLGGVPAGPAGGRRLVAAHRRRRGVRPGGQGRPRRAARRADLAEQPPRRPGDRVRRAPRPRQRRRHAGSAGRARHTRRPPERLRRRLRHQLQRGGRRPRRAAALRHQRRASPRAAAAASVAPSAAGRGVLDGSPACCASPSRRRCSAPPR